MEVNMSGDSPPPLSSKFNLSKMIRLDDMENVLNMMMNRIESQEQSIIGLQTLCGSLLSKSRANDTFEGLQRSIVDLNSRLDEVKTAATTQISTGSTISAGELSYLNSVEIQQLKSSVANCASQLEFADRMGEVEEQLRVQIDNLKENTTSLNMGKSLQNAQMETSNRLNIMENLVSLKVDKAEINHLQSLSDSLQAYDKFKDESVQFQDNQRQFNNDVGEKFREIDTDKETNDTDKENIYSELNNRVTLQEYGLAQEKLRILDDFKKVAVTQETLQELVNTVIGESNRSNNMETAIRTLQDELQFAMENLTTKASIADMKACVLRTHYDEAVMALGSDLDTKSSQDNLNGVDDRVLVLEDKMRIEQERIAVAMRFVEWFISRGENYEHNMAAVDKHLSKLTKANTPYEQKAYTGAVKFTPLAARYGAQGQMTEEVEEEESTRNLGNVFGYSDVHK